MDAPEDPHARLAALQIDVIPADEHELDINVTVVDGAGQVRSTTAYAAFDHFEILHHVLAKIARKTLSLPREWPLGDGAMMYFDAYEAPFYRFRFALPRAWHPAGALPPVVLHALVSDASMDRLVEMLRQFRAAPDGMAEWVVADA